MPTKGLAIRVSHGQMEVLQDAPVDSSQWLNEQVGGYVEVALTDRMGGLGNSIVVWCNEEGHVHNLYLNVLRCTDGFPLAGDLIITGANAEGENIGLSKEQASRVRLLQYNPVLNSEARGRLPILEIRP